MKRPYVSQFYRQCFRLNYILGHGAMLDFRVQQLKRELQKSFKPIELFTEKILTKIEKLL